MSHWCNGKHNIVFYWRFKIYYLLQNFVSFNNIFTYKWKVIIIIGIYKITNNINGKIYVGQSVNIAERWKQHEYKAFNSKEKAYTSAIHQAYRKYGIKNFSYEVIEQCRPEELDEKEIYWIQKLNSLSPNGYNILTGGQKVRVLPENCYCKKCGKEITRHSKSGMCLSCVQLTCDITKTELYEKLTQYQGNFTQVGKIFGLTDNAIRKRCRNFGLPYHSSDYKLKKEEKPKIIQKKPIAKIDKTTGEILETFESAAARKLGISKGSHITEACRGTIKSAYGFYWKYL